MTKEMNPDPFNLELGSRFKDLRDERALTREQLLEKLQKVTNNAFFNHVNNLRRVETGETSLKIENLIILAHVLEADLNVLLAALPSMPEEEKKEDEEELRQEIQRYINLVQYDKAAELVEQLSNKKSRQFKYWCEGFLAHRQQKNVPLAHKKFLQALKISLPAAFHKKTEAFLPDKLDGFELNWLECHIWMGLANIQSSEEAVVSYERLYEKLAHSKIFSSDERDKMLSGICYNLSVRLLAEGKLDRRIQIYCYKGISIELASQEHVRLGLFYYNLARYYFMQDNIDNAKKFFQRSYDFFNVTQDFERAEKTFNMVKEQYNITLRKDSWD